MFDCNKIPETKHSHLWYGSQLSLQTVHFSTSTHYSLVWWKLNFSFKILTKLSWFNSFPIKKIWFPVALKIKHTIKIIFAEISFAKWFVLIFIQLFFIFLETDWLLVNSFLTAVGVFGGVSTVDQLLENGMPVDESGGLGETALHFACCRRELIWTYKIYLLTFHCTSPHKRTLLKSLDCWLIRVQTST